MLDIISDILLLTNTDALKFDIVDILNVDSLFIYTFHFYLTTFSIFFILLYFFQLLKNYKYYGEPRFPYDPSFN
jgi:hypothetical protein